MTLSDDLNEEIYQQSAGLNPPKIPSTNIAAGKTRERSLSNACKLFSMI
jgi:hypothetical protein